MRCSPWKLVLPALLGMAACGPSQSEYESALAELDLAKNALTSANARIAELENTPVERLARARRYQAASDTIKAESEFRDLLTKYRDTSEGRVAAEVVASIDERRENARREAEQRAEAARREAERRARLGFRILEPKTNMQLGDVSVRIQSVERTNRWVVDRYDDSWRYYSATRGTDYAAVNLSISSESHNPELPPIYVYRLENGRLQRVAMMQYAFYRWDDYGSYLGNDADYANDFAHSRTVRFTAAAEISESALAESPMFVLIGRTGCFSRSRERFGTPAVRYSAGNCSNRSSLTAEEADRDFITIRVFNRNRIN